LLNLFYFKLFSLLILNTIKQQYTKNSGLQQKYFEKWAELKCWK